MLAGSEVSSGVSAGIADSLPARLSNETIPAMEADLRGRRVKRDIVDLNTAAFAEHLWAYLEALSYILNEATRINDTFDLVNPPRHIIPTLSRGFAFAPPLYALANDATYAFAIAAACRQAPEAISDLHSHLKATFDSLSAVASLARSLTTLELPPASSFDDALMDALRRFTDDSVQAPRAHFLAGVRFFQYAVQSQFKGQLVPTIAAWQRGAWKKIVDTERFLLTRPQQTVPAINDVLSTVGQDQRMLARLLIAASGAVGIAMPEDMQKEFARLARS
jgi:hypothetical protein